MLWFSKMDSIKIEQMVKDTDFDLRLELLAGEAGLDRRIVSSRSAVRLPLRKNCSMARAACSGT